MFVKKSYSFLLYRFFFNTKFCVFLLPPLTFPVLSHSFQIYVSFEVVALSANGSDYRIQSRNITLVEKQRVAVVPVDIIHDMTPEFDESFQIKLTSVAGGAELGSPLECTVTILENDYPYGLIGKSWCKKWSFQYFTSLTFALCAIKWQRPWWL